MVFSTISFNLSSLYGTITNNPSPVGTLTKPSTPIPVGIDPFGLLAITSGIIGVAAFGVYLFRSRIFPQRSEQPVQERMEEREKKRKKILQTIAEDLPETKSKKTEFKIRRRR